MRILHVLPSLGHGGVETSTVRLAIAQKRLGAIPIIVSSGGPFEDVLREAGITHISADVGSKNPVRILKGIRQLRHILATTACDIVHVHSRVSAWCVYYALRGTKTKFVSTFHGAYGHQNALKRAYNHVMLKGKAVAAVSCYIKDHIQQTYDDYPEIRVIYPGIDLDYFSPAHVHLEDRRNIRKAWGVEEDDLVLFLPGRISRVKGHLIAIEALKYLKDPKVKLVIMGEGPDEYKTELVRAAQDFPSQVIFQPAQNDLRAAYVASDIVLNTKIKPEAFGLTVLEAQAMGRPAIVTNEGGPQEIIQESSGAIVPPRDPRKLAEAIGSLRQREIQIDEQHLRRFDRMHSAQQWLELYTECVKG